MLPAVSCPDIVNYLLFTPSPYTLEDMKSYKSLQAYNQVVEGWVHNVVTMETNNLRVVKGQVYHSQKLKEKPLKPWIIAQLDGKVISAHCDCLADLEEVCTQF